MSPLPAISVILPTYNRAQVLQRAIDSVLEQTEPDFELIIIDDGSTDETSDLLASLIDPRIGVIRSDTNRGGNWARNRGVEHARADLIAFIDSDDCYLPEKLASVLALSFEYPLVDVWLDSFIVHDHPGRGDGEKKKINPTGCSGVDFRAGIFQRRIAKATTAMSMRKEALFAVGLFDETLRRRQDLDVILRLSEKHVCMTTSDIHWVKYQTGDGVSQDARTFLDAVIAICDRHPDYLGDHPESLYRDLRSHFSKLLKRRQWKLFRTDAQRYRGYRPFDVSLPRLLLDRRVVEVSPRPELTFGT
jgi:glycosyltransferase involved in cell wall biosynthesis